MTTSEIAQKKQGLQKQQRCFLSFIMKELWQDDQNKKENGDERQAPACNLPNMGATHVKWAHGLEEGRLKAAGGESFLSELLSFCLQL